jgi:hypothetical protein
MSPDSILTLLDQLILKTKEKKVIWGKTSKTNSYKSSLRSGNITIEKMDARNQLNPFLGDNFYSLSVYDDKGDKLFERSTGGIQAVFTHNTDPNFEIVKEKITTLFGLIQDASGNNLRNILNELNSL